jgi:hypothetical protein
MKNKNPLYVVKGSTVMEAKSLFDMVLKKFNLEPAFEVLMNIIRMLLSQVQSYPAFMVVKHFVDMILTKLGLHHPAQTPATA